MKPRLFFVITFMAFFTGFGAHASPQGDSRDFDNDGFDDLVVGVSGENIDGTNTAGAAHVLFGSGAGVTVEGDQFWHQDRTGLGESAEEGDFFGYAFAVGDFDGDGFSDLAISAPFEDHEDLGVLSAGVVHVLYGGAGGLRNSGAQLISQAVPGIADVPGGSDSFGEALAAGDFDGDGFDDLAIGVPQENPGGVNDAGAVHALYGSPDGLTTDGAQFWHRDRPGIDGDAEEFDRWGTTLAIGDFDDDSFDDLAIGVPGAVVGGHSQAGIVQALYGSQGGLRALGNQVWSEDSQGVHGTAEDAEHFGTALASDDLNGDGFDDLAIGVPLEEINGNVDAGAVYILFGSDAGLARQGVQLWHEDVDGVPDKAEGGEGFGFSFGTGDFDGDGFADLAISAYREDVNAFNSAGSVHVLRGSPSGLTTQGVKRFTQESNGIESNAGESEFFGAGLLGADFDNDGFDDLAIGSSGEDVSGQAGAGAVHVLRGSRDGPKGVGSQFLHQDVAGVRDEAEEFEDFGFSLGG